MKYFIDTEFLEGFKKPLFGKKRHFIDLVSIGVVCEDGRTFYAVSSEYDYNKASDWVKENVILPIYKDKVHGDVRNNLSSSNFHKHIGKRNSQIALDLLIFFGCWRDQHFWRTSGVGNPPEIYGYYADYDWVLFCSLFCRMIDLPKGFPMYCRDLKQTLDEKAEGLTQLDLTGLCYKTDGTNWKLQGETPKSVINIKDYTTPQKIELIKAQDNYPKQDNEHNALADARWNYELYKFLKTI